MRNREWISRAITQVLDGAESTGCEYTHALGLFNDLDWELIATGVYQRAQINHALEHGVKDIITRRKLCND